MLTVPCGLPRDHPLCEETFPPQGHEPPEIQVLGMKAPEAHSVIITPARRSGQGAGPRGCRRGYWPLLIRLHKEVTKRCASAG